MRYLEKRKVFERFDNYRVNLSEEDKIYNVAFSLVQRNHSNEVIRDFMFGNDLQKEVLETVIKNFEFENLKRLNDFLQFTYYKNILKRMLND